MKRLTNTGFKRVLEAACPRAMARLAQKNHVGVPWHHEECWCSDCESQRRAAAQDAQCEARESGGVRCELRSGHTGGHWISKTTIKGRR